ncbi:helix-turn-helix domain-containing protein [Candidatus Woesearchaeota archaeon]|nr:helix-turn-helix domain-containing protein [Candidatus Woesearchaeota archaeon]
MRFSHKITIINIDKPIKKNINEDLQFLGSSLGLFGLRDKDKSCYRIFLELLKAAKIKVGLSSDELAAKLELSRGTAVHHLNKLMEAGIAINIRNRYYLREENLKYVILKIKKDLEDSVNELIDIAEEIDDAIGL